MGDKDVQLMLLIFLLSGAFTVVSRATGGVEAVVALGLSVIPAALILPGIFLLATAIALALVTAPEGLQRLAETHPDVELYTASIDERLNEHGYILPGLGDAGDKIFGTK